MITTLTHLAIMLLDRIEAEGRVLRRAVANLGWALAFIVIAALLLLVSAGFFVWGLYQFIAVQTSPLVAALLLSFVTLVLAAIAAAFALWRVR
jgi:hypothetical protein